MTTMISSLINQGVSPQILTYLILTPLLATLIVFLRQVIGIKSMGVYHPLLLTFAFIGLGIKEGIIAFLIIVVLANLITSLVKKFSLLYLPRITIVVTSVTLALLVIIFLLRFTEFLSKPTSYLPLIIILALGDKLVSVQIKRNLRPTLILVANTLITAVAGFYLLNSQWLKTVALEYPFSLLALILLINILLGKYRGLRINELWRFRRLLKLPSKD